MLMLDPIADLLTRIRNANMRCKESLSVPSSKIKLSIVEVLNEEGFIRCFSVVEGFPYNEIKINLKYDNSFPVIRYLVRVSRPGLRQYIKSKDMKPIINGQGIAIISTSQGIFSDRVCREKNIGGELLCKVW